VVSGLNDQKVVASNLVSFNIQDGNVVKTMQGSIPAPNPGSFDNDEKTGSQMVHTKKYFNRNGKNMNP
jgi:hypothetical protein